MRTTPVLLVVALLGAVGCASTPPPPAPAPDLGPALSAYLQSVNQASPDDRVLDFRDSSLRDRLAAPVELRRTEPPLSLAARRSTRDGKVVLAGIVERDGSVSNVQVLFAAAHADFTASSIEAVRAWRYKPATFDGSPVRLLLLATTSYRVR